MSNSYEIVGIIPARYASTRFPGKLLADLNGKTVIQHVYEKCCHSKSLTRVIIATDDLRIYDHAMQFGAEVVMTAPSIQNGTLRCLAALKKTPHIKTDFMVNIQGDEPFILPEEIDHISEALCNGESDIVTLVTDIDNPASHQDPNVVKVVLDQQNYALYFSRLAIPYLDGDSALHTPLYQHIGIYGFRLSTLRDLIELPPTTLEKAEKLEQLRWLQHRYPIKTIYTSNTHIGIDVPDDLLRAKAQLKKLNSL